MLVALSASCLNLRSPKPNGKIIWENSYRARFVGPSVACRIQGSPGRSVKVFFCFLSLPEVYHDDDGNDDNDSDGLVNPHFQAIVSNFDLLPRLPPSGFWSLSSGIASLLPSGCMYLFLLSRQKIAHCFSCGFQTKLIPLRLHPGPLYWTKRGFGFQEENSEATVRF